MDQGPQHTSKVELGFIEVFLKIVKVFLGSCLAKLDQLGYEAQIDMLWRFYAPLYCGNRLCGAG